jgi:Zn-dependent protease with chaperone function
VITPLALGTFALLANSIGSRLLDGARWTRRAPGLGIIAWQVLTASVLLAIMLAGLTLALPSLPVAEGVASLIDACASALRQEYRTPGGLGPSVAGAILALGLAGRVVYSVASGLRTTRRDRLAQHRDISLAGRYDDAWRVSIVDHAAPAVYCIPGWRSKIIFTNSAFATLDDEQMRAVIAHERAHLRGRHDLVLALAGALRRAVPRLACTRIGHAELARLVEMRADDVALRTTDRLVMARALVTLADGPLPAGGLGAGGSARARLHRLVNPPRSIGWLGRLLVAAAAITLLLLPMAIAAEPAAAAAVMNVCPIDIPA